MVLICSKCEARLQLDDAKAPARPFTVRCPKCQTSVNVPTTTDTKIEAASVDARAEPETSAGFSRASFERPVTAPRFTPPRQEVETAVTSTPGTLPGLNDLAKLLAEAMRQSGGVAAAGRIRPAWDRRKILVCSSPAYREVIASPLAERDYDVFVAENTAQALGRMREERMDIVILDANFDPLEQGVAFVTREVRLLRPSERRRLFFVYVTSGVRTMDLHAAFLHNVNLVINPSDIDQLPEALEVSLRHYNELYRDFVRALDVAPI